MKLRGITAAVLIWSCFPALAQQDGAALYSQHCAQCHDSGNRDIRAPDRSVMRSMTFEAVLGTITSGSMASMVEGRTRDERAAIASFVTGKVAGLPGATGPGGGCVENAAGFLQAPDGPQWNGWGADVSNSRFQPAAMAGLTQDQVPRLKLKWAFGFPGAAGANAQPTIIGGLVFVGGSDRKVYALDAKSGCTRWAFATDAHVRTAISVAPSSGAGPLGCLFLGDLAANAYAVNATTGAWCGKPGWRIIPLPGSPVRRPCIPACCMCRFHRSRKSTGSPPPTNAAPFAAASLRWMPRPASRSGRLTPSPSRRARQPATPSGPSFMVRPARRCCPRRPSMSSARRSMSRPGQLFNPPAETSDAVIAFDLATGRMLWHHQATAKDSFVVSCFGADRATVPKTMGRTTTSANRRSWWTCTTDSVSW